MPADVFWLAPRTAVEQLGQRRRCVGAQRIGMRDDLELPLGAADRRHLRDAGTGQQPRGGPRCRRPCAASADRRRSDEIAKNRISPMIDEIGASTGRSTCGGSVPPTSASFSATSCRAMKMSVPQSNSTQTTAMPTAVADRTRRTPEAPLMALSIGKRDQRLHLLGRHAVALGEDRDRRRGEVGKDVDRHLPRRPRAGGEQSTPTAR